MPNPPQPPSPNIHCLKCIEPYFSDVIAGRKRFEVRKNDRGFKVGDTLRLEAYDPDRREYTGSRKDFHVCYMIEGLPYLPEGTCVMQLGAVPVPSSSQPPSPAQRIEEAFDSARSVFFRMAPEATVSPAVAYDALSRVLAAVRDAIREMEEQKKDGIAPEDVEMLQKANDALAVLETLAATKEVVS